MIQCSRDTISIEISSGAFYTLWAVQGRIGQHWTFRQVHGT